MSILSMMLVLVPLVLIFVIAALAKSKGREEDMFRNLYIYLVLFTTLMLAIGGGISIFMAAADLISPQSYYQSFEEYKTIEKENSAEGQSKGDEAALSDEQLKAKYDQLVKDYKNRQIQDAKNQIIKSLGFIIIPLPIFIYFSRLRNKTV